LGLLGALGAIGEAANKDDKPKPVDPARAKTAPDDKTE
jgi:hypothetical protein